ncbi:MAG: hypothetical protein ACRD40_04505, partial [Candidatus Acidiferrales bacterium]
MPSAGSVRLSGTLVLYNVFLKYVKVRHLGRYTLAMDDAARLEAELKVLRLLLYRASAVESPNPPNSELTSFLDQLTGYEWMDHEHRVVFQCLGTARRTRVIPLRTQMALMATRLGHPDLDWN